MISRGLKYRLYPTEAQAGDFARFAGVCRLVYNLALEQRCRFYRQFEATTGKRLTYVAQARELTALRADTDWIASVSQTCQQQALRDLDQAYQRFFSGVASYPRPRKKGVHDSFRFQGREVSVRTLNRKWAAVKLPKIGWVRFRLTRPVTGTLKNATIRHSADGWTIAFCVEIDHVAPGNDNPAVGIDRGVANTVALSNGEIHRLPESLATIERKRRQAQRVLARRKRGSRRYSKQRRRVARLQARAARIRTDWLHRLSLNLARRFGDVVIEDLQIRGMTASARGTMDAPGSRVRAKAGLNRSILSQSWHRFETLLGYKLEERGGTLSKVAARYTSQTCGACGTVDSESRKSQATFHCQTCGHRAHADINAAVNILRRNTAFMDVEVEHWFPCEASTGRAFRPENPHPSGEGRC